MMKLKYILLLLLSGIVLLACEKEEAEDELLLPSNLQLKAVADTETYGLVDLNISAENANFFKVYFREGEGAIKTKEEVLQHIYEGPGTYTIVVQAHTTEAAYITDSTTITIRPQEVGGYTTPESYEGWELVWQDEFNGESLNTADWNYEIGNGSNGWGNNELQYYRQENTKVEDGKLIITARKEAFDGQEYTSSRLTTQAKQSFQYGRIDIRAMLPEGQGIWPALWMLGSNIKTSPWPASGEIDIMEMVGGKGRENTVHGTIHWDNNGQYASYGKGYPLEEGTFADSYHVFSIIWDENSIKWYVDDELFNEVDITPEALSEFHQEFFLIFNVAVGGNWPGSPDESTLFPQQMKVDYVRVFQPE